MSNTTFQTNIGRVRANAGRQSFGAFNPSSPLGMIPIVMGISFMVTMVAAEMMLRAQGVEGGIAELLSRSNTTFRTQIGRVNVRVNGANV